MSFLSKLFGRKKVQDRKFDSEVEKVIEPTTEPIEVEIPEEERVTPEQALAAWVLDLSENGKFNKDYKLVHNFLVNTDARKRGLKGLVGGMVNTPLEDFTPEMISFIKQYRVRGLKCSDKEFQDWILSVVIG